MALTTNLVSYWKLSNGAYSTDSVGANTLTTTGSTQQSAGFIGYGGSGDNIKATTNFGLTGTSDISISWWVKMTTDITATGVGFLFQDSTLTTDRLLALDYQYNGGTRRLNLYNGSAAISNSYNVTLGTTWHHIVITRTSGAVDLYLDGSKVMSAIAQGSTTGAQNVLSFGTGKQYGGSATEYYDELGFWSRAITSTEVTTLYNSGAGNQYPFSTAYTLALVTGTFTYTGVSSILTSARSIVASVGTFTLTGIDALFTMGKGIVAGLGQFTYTGVNATLSSSRKLTAAVGSFTLTGIDIAFKLGHILTAAVGSFILTGYNAILTSPYLWTKTTKNTSTWTDETKNTSTWTDEPKS